MKVSKIIIGIVSILLGIFALIESYDVFRLAQGFGVNGFHIYVGFIVGFIFIGLGIYSLMMMDKQSKKYAEITSSLSCIAIFLCFRGPEIFSDLTFFAAWGAIMLVFAIVAYYSTKKDNEDEELTSQATSQSVAQNTCPSCHAIVDGNSAFCSSCGAKIKKPCPHCGAMTMENSSFCSNCGKKIDEENASSTLPPTQPRCPHCGALIKEGDVFCESCGKKVDNKYADIPVQQLQTSSDNGNLTIRWDGAFALVDAKIKMSVNHSKIGEFSFKQGFETTIPITSSNMTITTKVGLYSATEKLELNPNENYTYELAYLRMSGWFGFILYNNDGFEIRRDKLHWGMWILSFLIPIAGFIYAIVGWKKRPASSYTAIYTAVLGAFLSIFVLSNFKPQFNNLTTSNKTTLVQTDSIEEAVDSIAEIDINDIHSEAFVKARLEEICLAYNDPNISEEKTIEKFFSSDFRKMYNTISVLESNGKGGDGLWYSGGFLDGSSEIVDKMSVGEIYNINENEAIVDFVYHSGDSKYTQTVNLVLEDRNWFVDDICNRKSDMKEYIDSMMSEDITVADTVAVDDIEPPADSIAAAE